MPRTAKLLRLAAPVTILLGLGCSNNGAVLGIFGPPAEPEVVVNGKAPNTQVVPVEDSLPKPPRFSPYIVDHGTLSPYVSPTPQPSTSPSTPTQPTPSQNPGPSASPDASASPSAAPASPGASAPASSAPSTVPSSAPSTSPLTYGGKFTATLVAGGTSGDPADGKGAVAVLGANSSSSVGMSLLMTSGAPSAILFTDAAANQVRQVTLSDDTVSRVAGDVAHNRTGNDNDLYKPSGCIVDLGQNTFYFTDTGHNRIANIPPGGTPTWIAGPALLNDFVPNPTPTDGPGSGLSPQATLNGPSGIVEDAANHILYLAEHGFDDIRSVDTQATNHFQVTLVAGSPNNAAKPSVRGEPPLATHFNQPSALCLGVDPANPTLYVADTANHMIRAIDLTGGKVGNVTIVAGTGDAGNNDGPVATATFNQPCALAADKTHLYVGEFGTPRIRMIDLKSGTVSTVLGMSTAGNGTGDQTKASFGAVTGLVAALDSNSALATLYAFDAGPGDGVSGGRILAVTPVP